MSSTSRRSHGPGTDLEMVLLWSAITIVVLVALAAVAAVHLAVLLDGGRSRLPGNPAVLAVDLVKGHVAWPTAATPIAAGLGVGLVALAAGIGWSLRSVQRDHVDHAARWMAADRTSAGCRPATLAVSRRGSE